MFTDNNEMTNKGAYFEYGKGINPVNSKDTHINIMIKLQKEYTISEVVTIFDCSLVSSEFSAMNFLTESNEPPFESNSIIPNAANIVT
jgi:hypothetical protein